MAVRPVKPQFRLRIELSSGILARPDHGHCRFSASQCPFRLVIRRSLIVRQKTKGTEGDQKSPVLPAQYQPRGIGKCPIPTRRDCREWFRTARRMDSLVRSCLPLPTRTQLNPDTGDRFDQRQQRATDQPSGEASELPPPPTDLISRGTMELPRRSATAERGPACATGWKDGPTNQSKVT